jgi:hypothetical protein
MPLHKGNGAAAGFVRRKNLARAGVFRPLACDIGKKTFELK